VAFELPGQTPLWEIAGSAVGVHPLHAGGYAVLHGDCSIQRLDANRQSLWRRPSGARACTAIHEPVPGGPLLVATGSTDGYLIDTTPTTLRWVNAENGAPVGISARLMPSFASGNRWKVVPTVNAQSVLVTAGGSWGLMEAEILVPPADVIFTTTWE
jgi:hypothetical protein